MARVLVVDDEPAVRRALERALRLDRYDVELAGDGEEALDALAKAPPDAVILDIGMPKLDGLEVCRRMRQAGDRTPILMLTARDAIDDRVEGLDVGADDYLVKPFALRELQARLRALLRRSGEGADGEILRYADLVLDPVAHEVRRGDRVIELSKTEFLLLELFMRHPRQVLTRSHDLRERVGLRLRPDLQRARRVHGLPAPQDRSRTTSRGSCTRSGASATCCGTDGGPECHCAADSP